MYMPHLVMQTVEEFKFNATDVTACFSDSREIGAKKPGWPYHKQNTWLLMALHFVH